MSDLEWNTRLASRTAGFQVAQAVNEVLALTERPDVISFAGGLPDPEVFQLSLLKESVGRVLAGAGREALNYGPTLGYKALRQWIAARMRELEGVELDSRSILVTSGGVEALNLVATALLEPGSSVLVGAPTFMAALHIFRSQQCQIQAVEVDAHGLDPDALEEALRHSTSSNQPRLLYVIPSFQNPSGATLDLQRRQRVVRVCQDHGIPIVEDHAYADLRFEGQAIPSLKQLWPEGVIFIHTFSKIFAPGVRLGWVAAEPNMIATLGLCKIGSDQCSSPLAQRIVHDYAARGGIEQQVERAILIYRRKRDRLLAELSRLRPGGADWVKPEGGFYVWLRLSPGSDSESLLRRAIEEYKVAFVAGTPFFADGRGKTFLRLSYSFVSEESIPEGVSRLAAVLE